MGTAKAYLLHFAITISVCIFLVMTVYSTYFSLDNFHTGFSNLPSKPNETYSDGPTPKYTYDSYVRPLTREYTKYLKAWEAFSEYFNKSQTYVIIPCSVTAFFLLAFLLNVYYLQDMLRATSTAFIHYLSCSFVALGSQIVYINLDSYFYDGPSYSNAAFQWKYVFILGAMLFCGNVCMTVITAFQLTKKIFSFPSISKILNLNRILDGLRMLAAITIIYNIFYRPRRFTRGMIDTNCTHVNDDEGICHKVPYPWLYGYTIICAVLTSLIACIGSSISGIISTSHRGLDVATTGLSVIIVGISSLVTSNFFLFNILHMELRDHDAVVNVSYITLLVLTILHLILRLACPKFMDKSPKFITNISSLLASAFGLNSSITLEGSLKSASKIVQKHFARNILLLILSFTALCIVAMHHDCDFSSAMCVAANAVTSVSAASTLISRSFECKNSVKTYIQMIIEMLLLFISGTAVICTNWWRSAKFAGGLTICCGVLYALMLYAHIKDVKPLLLSLLPKKELQLGEEQEQETQALNQEPKQEEEEEETTTATNAESSENDFTVTDVKKIHDVI